MINQNFESTKFTRKRQSKAVFKTNQRCSLRITLLEVFVLSHKTSFSLSRHQTFPFQAPSLLIDVRDADCGYPELFQSSIVIQYIGVLPCEVSACDL